MLCKITLNWNEGVSCFVYKSEKGKMSKINPLHSNISMHILHTILYTFPKVLKREKLFNNQELLLLVVVDDHFLYFPDRNVWFRDDLVRRN